jgi:hypothetical protein
MLSMASFATNDLDAQPCGRGAIGKAEHAAEEHRTEQNRQRRPAQVGEHQAGGHRRDAQQRTDGQIDPARKDDERLADRQDTARGECADRVRKIRSVKEDVALGHDPREHDEDQTDVALQRSEQRQHPPQPAADGCGRDRHRRDRRFSGRAR